ncbi:MAG: hypothetical protein AABZ51_02585 [Nitrospirota bacterium]
MKARTDLYSFMKLGSVTFAMMLGLAGCNGGYGTSDSSSAGSDSPSYSAESEGQRLLLERTQERDAMSKKTQQSDSPTPESAAKKACEGFPGFDRGCPGSGK